MRAARHPGVQEQEEERVLLVTKNKITGAERVDWWPSVEEAERSNMIVKEVRQKISTPKQKKVTEWSGLKLLARLLLGASGTQDNYIRERPLHQKEFFESVDEKMKDRVPR